MYLRFYMPANYLYFFTHPCFHSRIFVLIWRGPSIAFVKDVSLVIIRFLGFTLSVPEPVDA